MATYKEIRGYIRDKHGFSAVTGWIADIKARHNLTSRIAYNRISPSKRVHPCPPNRKKAVEDAFRHFRMIK